MTDDTGEARLLALSPTTPEGPTEENILTMTPSQVRGMSRERNVSLTGCSNVEQWKERLILHLKVQKGHNFEIKKEFATRSSHAMGSILHTLEELFEKVEDAVTDLERNGLSDVLVGSGCDRRESTVTQIQQRLQALQSSQCSVIVAGETNAGKSTFLNLLLGMDILPVHIFSCTACICVLRYSLTYSATIVYRDRRATTKEFAGVDEARDWLTSIVAEKDDERREIGLDMEAIHISLPAVILQSGVTLVDTPGIGENEAMTSCTMEYVKQNSAAAYIYVIKTDNAGGVHDDRLLEFLRAILDFHKGQDNTYEVFDPSATMFVCNRWDQVPKDQQEGVRNNALSKLKDAWPRFEPRQAYFVSAVNAAMHMAFDERYVTADLECVLKGLKDVFNKARHNAINQHYRWLKYLLHHSTSSLQTTLYNCSQTDDDLINNFNRTRVKLEALQSKTNDTMKTLSKLVLREIGNLCNKIAAILQEQSIKDELTNWQDYPIPHSPGLGSGMARLTAWQEQVDMVIMKRILDKADTEVTARKLDVQLQDSLKKLMQEQLKLVDDEINSIILDMKDRNSLASSTSSNVSMLSTDSDEEHANASEMLRLYHERHVLRGMGSSLRHVSRLTEGAEISGAYANRRRSYANDAALATVPKILVKRMMKPVSDLVLSLKLMRRQSCFSTDPMHFMKERTTKVVQVVCDNRPLLEQMSAKYHDRLDNFIRDVDNSIPRFIANNKQLMEEIRNNRKKYLHQKDHLTAVMEKLEPIREMLRGFGFLYIRDVTADNVCFVLDVDQRRESVAISVQTLQKTPKHLSLDSGIGDLGASTGSFSAPHSRNNSGDSLLAVAATTVTSNGRPSTLSIAEGTQGISMRSSVVMTSPNAKRTSQGLWSTYNYGHVDIGKKQQHLIGRAYLQGPSEHNLIKEIARLRCLRCTALAPFLGMSRMEECGGPVFLFLGDLMSARRFLTKYYHDPRESVPRLLESVLQGLTYLHKERLVHMELTLDTIMVNQDGDAQLCGACLPRHARLPPDADHVNAEPFVYLSPEVLRGELYTADDDCYSFGLLVWETCLPKEDKPFAQQRDCMSLAKFRDTVHPSSMLMLDSKEDSMTPTLTAIIRGCLLPARGLRLRMEQLKPLVMELRSDRKVQALSCVSRRQKHVPKRGSTEETRDKAAAIYI